jgi:Domain of unknown function (DUF5659)
MIKKEYIVFSMKLAGLLMQRGFVLKRMEKTDRDNSNRNVFYFNESEDLLRVVEEYINNK